MRTHTKHLARDRDYAERLWVPASWWLLGEFSAATFASMAWAGFNQFVALASYLVICGGTAAVLLVWGSARIEVSEGHLRAGKSTLPLALAGEVAILDEAQAAALRGPRADPRAFMFIRGYLKVAVYIEVVGERSDAPYWLIATRRPAQLAAAIESSPWQARVDDTHVG